MKTSAPASARPSAIARPSPRPPPVTSAQRPERSKSCWTRTTPPGGHAAARKGRRHRRCGQGDGGMLPRSNPVSAEQAVGFRLGGEECDGPSGTARQDRDSRAARPIRPGRRLEGLGAVEVGVHARRHARLQLGRCPGGLARRARRLARARDEHRADDAALHHQRRDRARR